MIRYHDVSDLTTAELERAKRELQANLSLIASHSPAHLDRSTRQSGLWRGFGLDVNANAVSGLHIAFTASRPRLVPVDRSAA